MPLQYDKQVITNVVLGENTFIIWLNLFLDIQKKSLIYALLPYCSISLNSIKAFSINEYKCRYDIYACAIFHVAIKRIKIERAHWVVMIKVVSPRGQEKERSSLLCSRMI